MIDIHEIESFRYIKAARRLIRPGTEVLEGLAGEDTGDELRFESLIGLGKIGDPASLNLLQKEFEALPDCAEPISALGYFKSSTPVQKLIDRLEDPDSLFKEEIVRVLGEIGDPMATRNMKELLHDEDRMVRYYAAWALYKTGGRDVVQSLCGLLNDPDEWIVINVLDILSQLGDPEAIPALVGQFEVARDSRLKAIIISSLGNFREGRLLKTFEEGLSSFDPRIQANAVEAISLLKISGLEMKRKLKKFYGHPNNRVRANLCIALFSADQEKVTEEILAMVKSRDASTRRSAAFVLSRVEMDNRGEYIHRLLKDDNFGVRKMALTSALELDSALSLQEIQPLLKDDNPWVRKQAVECARKIEAFPSQAVVELFKQEENAAVVESILEYFISRNLTQAIPMIFDRIKTEPEEELPWLISALGHLGAVEELGKVKKFLSAVRSEVLTEYYRALLQNGDLSILDEVNEAISGKKREQDLVQWAIIAGELGLFFRNTENYSTKLMTSLAAEVEKDMAGIAGFDQVPAGAPSIQDFGRIQEILEQRDYGKARPELENFLKSFPEHDEASYGLANCMYQSGETDGAVAILERLFHRNPSYLDASVLLGQIFFRRKDWGKLAECYEKLGSFVAPTDKRNVIRVYGALGLAYFHQKRFAEAIEALGKGLKANPRDLSSSYHLALCHYAMGNTSIAREILEGLRKTLPPDSQVLKNVLELLQRIEVTV